MDFQKFEDLIKVKWGRSEGQGRRTSGNIAIRLMYDFADALRARRRWKERGSSARSYLAETRKYKAGVVGQTFSLLV